MARGCIAKNRESDEKSQASRWCPINKILREFKLHFLLEIIYEHKLLWDRMPEMLKIRWDKVSGSSGSVRDGAVRCLESGKVRLENASVVGTGW